jgi:hypothetical protein
MKKRFLDFALYYGYEVIIYTMVKSKGFEQYQVILKNDNNKQIVFNDICEAGNIDQRKKIIARFKDFANNQ